MSRIRRGRRIRWVASIALGAVLSAAWTAIPGASAQTPGEEPTVGEAETATPIEHFIFLMQENHSFDNYFGTYPGADGIPSGTCMPHDPVVRHGACTRPSHLGQRAVTDLGHSREVHLGQYRNGKMDGFISTFDKRGEATDTVMGYYDRRDIPYYWSLADDYVLFDRFFSSAGGGSVWNHLYWISGRPGSREDEIPADGFTGFPTIFDRLEAEGISWKFYIQNYDPTITYRSGMRGDRGSQVVWAPVLAFPRFLDRPELNEHIVNLDEYYDDLRDGTLPAVSFMVPSGASEHPPGSIQAGQRFVRGLITQLMMSSSWDTSAFLWSYDDWGGWYDHVRPPEIDRLGYGFRVPAQLVSPYARRGFIDSTTLDFTSGLAFIETNWGVEPLAKRDARANDLTSAFDFAQAPRAPVLMGGGPGAIAAPASVNRLPIYVAYSAALLFALAAVLWALRSSREVEPGEVTS